MWPFFYFWLLGPNLEISSKAPQKGKIPSLFLPKFNWQYHISKMVLLSIRRWRELNLCGFFYFGVMHPNMASRPHFTPKGLSFNFVLTKVLLTIKHFQKGLIEHQKVKRTELIQIFLILHQWAQIWKLGPSCPPKKVKFQFCSYQRFTDNKAFPKRSYWLLKGYKNWTYTDYFNFGAMGPNIDIKPQLPQKE